MKRQYLILSALFLTSCISITGCNKPSSGNSQQEYEDYYTIDVTSISKEVLRGATVSINPTFKNLGDPATPNFGVKVTCDGEDVTDEVYNPATQSFVSYNVGVYELTITVLN